MIKNNDINLRLVEEKDNQFILNLRLTKGKHLSQTNPDLEQQKNWIRNYKNRESKKAEYYFIITNKNNISVGTARIYNIDYAKKIFTFGSFIIEDNVDPKDCAYQAMKLVLDFAFNQLQLEKCVFDCRKENHHANRFYLRFGAKIVESDDLNFYYEINNHSN